MKWNEMETMFRKYQVNNVVELDKYIAAVVTLACKN